MLRVYQGKTDITNGVPEYFIVIIRSTTLILLLQLGRTVSLCRLIFKEVPSIHMINQSIVAVV